MNHDNSEWLLDRYFETPLSLFWLVLYGWKYNTDCIQLINVFRLYL